jgi:hypothetical protein
LNLPRAIFATQFETESTPSVTDQIVDSPKSVEWATELTAQQGMYPPGMNGRGRDLQDAIRVHGLDELVLVSIRFETASEGDADRVLVFGAHERRKEVVGLPFEVVVRRNDLRVAGRARTAQIPRPHLGSHAPINVSRVRSAFQESPGASLGKLGRWHRELRARDGVRSR